MQELSRMIRPLIEAAITAMTLKDPRSIVTVRKQPKTTAKLRILIVDDVRGNRKMLRHTLEKQLGQTVEEAVDGAEALRMVGNSFRSKKAYDVIFMDCIMPIMDGPTAAREIFSIGYTVRPSVSTSVRLSVQHIFKISFWSFHSLK